MRAMRSLLVMTIVFLCGAMAGAAELADKQWINLWEGEAPGQKGKEEKDVPGVRVFLADPAKSTGASFVVCPGGGYGGLANHEKDVVGEWFAKNGVTAFVLRYRLGPKYNHPIELGDAQRAVRLVRANAEKWKLDPKKIGILGFSAGGHLAASTSVHFTEGDKNAADPVEHVSSRPDLSVLIYPVITMGEGGHAGSRKNLLGDNPPQELIDLLSAEKQVTEKTPPAFLVHSTQDTPVPVGNSDKYAAALKRAGVPYEYIRGEYGGHGFGLKPFWTEPCVAWLKKNGFAN